VTSFRFLRRRAERKLVLDGDFPDTSESVTEILRRVQPASYDGVTFGGASDAGLSDGGIFGFRQRSRDRDRARLALDDFERRFNDTQEELARAAAARAAASAAGLPAAEVEAAGYRQTMADRGRAAYHPAPVPDTGPDPGGVCEADAAAGLRQAIELTATAERGPGLPALPPPPDGFPAPHAESSLQVLDLGQLWQAIGFLQFRAGLDPSQDSETVARASRVLRAEPGASLSVRVWGLDPGDPDSAADFSDVTRSLSDWAQDVWGRHAGGTR
jgi:hypothetical protein